MTTSIPSGRALIMALGVSGLGDLGSKAALLLTTIVVARAVNPDGFAAYAGLLAISLIAAAVWDAGISTLVSVQGARNAPLGALARRVVRARMLTLPIAIATLSGGFLIFGQITPLEPGVVALVAGITFLSGCSIPLQAWLRSRLAFGRATGALLLGRWIAAGGTLGLAILNPVVPLAWLFGTQAIGEALTLGALIFAVPRNRAGLDPRWDSHLIGLRAALPFAANTVLNIAYNRLDIVLVAVLTTAAQLAAYVPASRLQDAAYLLPTAISVVALPQLSRMLATGGGHVEAAAFVRVLWRYALVVALPSAVVLVLWMPGVIATLLSAEYVSAVPAARILVLSVIIASIGSPILALLIAAGRGWATTRAFVVAFAVSVILHLLLDAPFGAIGAAVASTARDVANVGVAAWLARDLLWLRLARQSGIASHPEGDDTTIETGRLFP